MDRNVTQEELIKFVYGELSFADTADLYDKIDDDAPSLKTLETYAALKFELDRLVMKPSNKVEKNIIEFSASYK
ncbi:MAG: hypothetical protein JXQ87_10295 [Bacteroidia bacterium]